MSTTSQQQSQPPLFYRSRLDTISVYGNYRRFFGRKIPRLKVLLATGFVQFQYCCFFFFFCFVFRFASGCFPFFFLSFFLSSFSSPRLFFSFRFFFVSSFFLSFRAALFRSFRCASNACNHSKGGEEGWGRKRGLSGSQEASAFAVLACYVRTDAGNISLFSGSIEWLFFSFRFSFFLFFFVFYLVLRRLGNWSVSIKINFCPSFF